LDEDWVGKGFGEDVSGVVMGADAGDGEHTVEDLFMGKVILDVDIQYLVLGCQR